MNPYSGRDDLDLKKHRGLASVNAFLPKVLTQLPKNKLVIKLFQSYYETRNSIETK